MRDGRLFSSCESVPRSQGREETALRERHRQMIASPIARNASPSIYHTNAMGLFRRRAWLGLVRTSGNPLSPTGVSREVPGRLVGWLVRLEWRLGGDSRTAALLLKNPGLRGGGLGRWNRGVQRWGVPSLPFSRTVSRQFCRFRLGAGAYGWRREGGGRGLWGGRAAA